MPLLGQLIFTVISELALFLARVFTQKVAVATAFAAVLTAMIAALFLAARAVIQTAVAAAGSVHPAFGSGVSMVIPPSCASLLGSYVTFWMLVEVYKWKVNLLQLWARTI